MRAIWGLALVGALVVVVPAKADVGTVLMTATNTIQPAASVTANLGSGVLIDKQDHCSLVFKFQGTNSTTGTIQATFARSADNSNWETTPRFSVGFAAANTTAVTAWTNLPQSVIGAAGYLKCVEVTNAAGAAAVTNFSITLVKKTLKASP